MPKLIRITTVPLSLKLLLKGQMKFMKNQGWEVLMVSADGKEKAQVELKEEVRHEVIPFTREITPFQDLYCLYKLIILFIKEKPDIVHTHTPKAGLLGMMAAYITGVKIRVHTLAGFPFMAALGNRKRFLESIEKFTFRFATNIWPNSFGLKEMIISKNLCSEDKVMVVGRGSSNGVDLEKFNRGSLLENHLIAAIIRMTVVKDEFIVLFVGRLVKDKGIEELVKAFKQFKHNSKSKLVLLGSFEQHLSPISEETIKTISDSSNIIQIDWTDHVEHYMALSDVLVHSSHREGFPNVLLEAGAMELPIICSYIIGNNEIVENEKTGLIFPVKDTQKLLSCLEFAFENRVKMQDFATNLNQKVKTFYERSQIHNTIFFQYNQLLNEAKH